ncbi:MAG: hypothetical protein WCR30_01560 [Clostridia bacterium]
MKDNIYVCIQSSYNCNISLDDISCEIQRLSFPKCFLVKNQTTAILKVFPLESDDGVPYATKLDFACSENPSSSENIQVYFANDNNIFVFISKSNNQSLVFETRQIEAVFEGKKASIFASCFNEETAISLFYEGKNLHCKIPFLADSIQAIEFASVLAILCENVEEKAILLTDCKDDKIEIYVGNSLGFEDNKIQIYNFEQTICGHSTLTTISEEDKKVVENSELMFVSGMPNFAFSPKISPIAFYECIQLQDFYTAEKLITANLRNTITIESLYSTFQNSKELVFLPTSSNNNIFALVHNDKKIVYLDFEIIQEKINQIFVIDS